MEHQGTFSLQFPSVLTSFSSQCEHLKIVRMSTKSVLIQLSGNDLETIIFDCVDRAIKLNQSSTSSVADEVGGIELARQVTRLSAARIYTLVSKRLIPHKKRGNRLTFRRSELLNWLEEGNRETIGDPNHE